MNKLDELRALLRQKIENGITQKEIASSTGAQQSSISRLLQGEGLSAENFVRLAEWAGWEINPTPEAARNVCFVNARVAEAGSLEKPPEAEDYMAVPLVEEVGAGPGIIPQGALLSWFLVYKHQDAVRYRSDLIAVQIDKSSTSMIPTLAPRDIVLVDRHDRNVNSPGHIMLVMDEEGAGMIKRVSVQEVDNGRDWRIIYYSDNAAENPPMLYSLREHFMGDWSRAIVGRVVWAWSDISNK